MEPWCFKPSNCCSGQSQQWSLEAQRPNIYKEQEWVHVNDVDANAGNYSSFYSLSLDFKISKGSRIYEGDNRHSKHEGNNNNNNTEILNKPGVYWQEVPSGDHTEI